MRTKRSLRIPISNVYGGGDYTAKILIGSEQAPANVILDTGSSTLAVKAKAYDGQGDTDRTNTSYAQDVTYGTGGWAGPVVETTVGMDGVSNSVSLPNTHLAITSNAQQGNFGMADGILGLAYHVLNNAYDLHDYLAQHGVNPPDTYPWPFTNIPNTTTGIRQFQQFLRRNFQEQDIEPYFTELEKQGYVANKFAFYTLRSSVNLTSKTETIGGALNDPLNKGYFILGGGEEQTDLYTGDFVSVQVVSDGYYNTKLKSVQVGNTAPISAAPLQSKWVPYAYSNSIVDSGTNSIALTYHLYQGILNALNQINSQFVYDINQFNQDLRNNQGFPMSQLDLDNWPDIHFTFEGVKGQDITLTCTPDTYWQTNSPAPGEAFFKISGGPNNPNQPYQSILGLPLMNNYYCIFDRSANTKGVINFAPINKNAIS